MTSDFYTAHAIEYAARTSELSLYPGLEHELGRFAGRLPRGAVVLDLGSGSGRDSRFFRSQGFRVIMLDRAEPLLLQARRLVGGDTVCLVADMRAVPLRDESIDGVWASGSLLHLDREDIPHAMTEAGRVLRPGGVFGLSMKIGEGTEIRPDGRHFTYVSVGELHELATSAGFRINDTIGPHRKAWVTLLLGLSRSGN